MLILGSQVLVSMIFRTVSQCVSMTRAERCSASACAVNPSVVAAVAAAVAVVDAAVVAAVEVRVVVAAGSSADTVGSRLACVLPEDAGALPVAAGSLAAGRVVVGVGLAVDGPVVANVAVSPDVCCVSERLSGTCVWPQDENTSSRHRLMMATTDLQ